MAGFGIYFRRSFLELSQNQLIIELNNTLYFGDDIDTISNNYVIQQKVKATNQNKYLLDNPQLVSNAKDFIKSEHCEIWAEGSALFVGELNVMEASNDDIAITIVINTAGILKETYINEIDYPIYGLNNVITTLMDSNTNNNYPFRAPVIYNPNQWVNRNGSLITSFGLNVFTNKVVEYESTISPAWIPFPKLHDVLKRLFEFANLTLSFTYQNELLQILMYRNNSITNQESLLLFNEIDIKRHLPKILAKDLIKSTMRTFNLGLFTDFFERTAEQVQAKDLLPLTPKFDWTRKTTNDISIKQEYKYPKRFSFNYPTALKSVEDLPRFINENLSDTEVAEGIYNNTNTNQNFYKKDSQRVLANINNFSDTPRGKEDTYTSPFLVMPQARIPSTRVEIPTGGGRNGNEPMTIMTPTHYIPKSMQEVQPKDAKTFELTMHRSSLLALSESERIVGNTTTTENVGNLSLEWNGEKGIYQNFWKEWEWQLGQKTVTTKAMLTVKDIRAFSMKDKVRIGDSNFFVRKMRIIINRFGIQPTELEMIKTI